MYAATPAEVAGHFCLEDGVSLEITPSGSNWYDFVLPIQPGLLLFFIIIIICSLDFIAIPLNLCFFSNFSL